MKKAIIILSIIFLLILITIIKESKNATNYPVALFFGAIILVYLLTKFDTKNKYMKQNILNKIASFNRLKLSFYISITGICLCILAVIKSLFTDNEPHLFFGGGVVFILYYFLRTYPHINKSSSELANTDKVLTTSEKIAGYLCILSGTMTLLSSFVPLIFVLKRSSFNSKTAVFILLSFVLFVFGFAILYYVLQTFKLFKSTNITTRDTTTTTYYECIHCEYKQLIAFEYCPKCFKNDDGKTKNSNHN